MGLFSQQGNPDSDAARSMGMSQLDYSDMMSRASANSPDAAKNRADADAANQKAQAEAAANEAKLAQERAAQQEAARQQAEQQAQAQKVQAQAQINQQRSQATQFAQARSRGAVNLTNPVDRMNQKQSKLVDFQASGFGVRGGINQPISNARTLKPFQNRYGLG
jgi:hypothetical protein